MKKIIIMAVLVLTVMAFSASFVTSAYAASPSSLNQGTCTAHTSGMPAADGHAVPGLAKSPFAGAEVPGHMVVPDPPGC